MFSRVQSFLFLLFCSNVLFLSGLFQSFSVFLSSTCSSVFRFNILYSFYNTSLTETLSFPLHHRCFSSSLALFFSFTSRLVRSLPQFSALGCQFSLSLPFPLLFVCIGSFQSFSSTSCCCSSSPCLFVSPSFVSSFHPSTSAFLDLLYL